VLHVLANTDGLSDNLGIGLAVYPIKSSSVPAKYLKSLTSSSYELRDWLFTYLVANSNRVSSREPARAKNVDVRSANTAVGDLNIDIGL